MATQQRLRGWRSVVATLALGLVCSTAAGQAATPTREDVAWLQRATFGIDSASLARYQQLGRQRYLDEQLSGREAPLPVAINALIASYDLDNAPPAQLLATERELRQQYKNAVEGSARDAAKQAAQEWRKRLSQQTTDHALLQAMYGSNQIKEQMAWFWQNHFSVYAAKGRVRVTAGDYLQHTIRPHALGKFRDLVLATLRSPAMLEYLDNDKNVKDKTNENYARELMELHTLGVNAGYSQQDVQQLALILTGAGLDLREDRGMGRRGRRAQQQQQPMQRDGLFVFNPARHDFSDKTFLGHTIKGSGYTEIEQAVTLITRQPACAQFISRQLATYFVSDQPPAALVTRMAQTFQRTDGDIAAVLRTLFTSPELLQSQEKKFKDPTQFMLSAVRLTLDGTPLANAAPLGGWLRQMGEPLFGHVTPDGWPLDGASWSSSGQMAKRFDVAAAIGGGRNRLLTADDGAKPARSPTPSLDTPLYRAVIAPYLSASTREALAKASSVAEWNTFLLSSPEFNYR
ncbi:MAG: DUF1800 domain-containing protein [Rhodanobacter sp.]